MMDRESLRAVDFEHDIARLREWLKVWSPRGLEALDDLIARAAGDALARRCEKCGETRDILVRWHGAGAYHPSRKHATCHGDHSPRRGNPSGEHIHVICRTCQFDWFEDTLDNLGGGS